MMNWINFEQFETPDSKFTAELSNKGGYVTFSNSGKGGNKKYFTLGLESFLSILKDINANLTAFNGSEQYEEKTWRDLGSRFYTDGAANAQSTVQTKPLFSTLSKLILWANSPDYPDIDPEESIVLDKGSIDKTIEKLSLLSNSFSPELEAPPPATVEKTIIFRNESVREFAKYVFDYFFSDNWTHILDYSISKPSKIGELDIISHDYEIFKGLIGEFPTAQTKDSLKSANTSRYFEDAVLIAGGKYYYFSNQWYGSGDYSLSFLNLKEYFEEKYPEYILEIIDGQYIFSKTQSVPDTDFLIATLLQHITESGLIYSKELITRFTASLLTKPFVILTGLSGSGKTKLAQAFVQWICQSPRQYCMVPVGADWTNREPLLGYPNALVPSEYVKPDNGALDLIMRANENPDLPYFLILDEMNLSHVERYFADFLSVMESNEDIPLCAEGSVENGVPSKLSLPPNLFIIGTVNIDETTNMFSPKVLDRANTIEFRVSKKEMEDFLQNSREIKMEALNMKGASMAKAFLRLAQNKSFPPHESAEFNTKLVDFFTELKKTGAEFGYRGASEIIRLINQLTILDSELSEKRKLDIAIMQKLLPKLHGSRRKLCPILSTLGSFCIDVPLKMEDVLTSKDFDFDNPKVSYPLALEKIVRMYHGAVDNGFTNYAEA